MNTLNSKIKKELLVRIFNPLTERFDFYRKTKRGKYLMCNPYNGLDYSASTILCKQQIDRLQNPL